MPLPTHPEGKGKTVLLTVASTLEHIIAGIWVKVVFCFLQNYGTKM
jgi:hypothetical protein